MSDDEMFKSMICEIVNDPKFNHKDVNEREMFFSFKKMALDGKHIGYTSEEKASSSFVYKDRQNLHNSTDFYTVEFKKVKNE